MKNIVTTLKLYILLILCFTFFRIILFITNWDKVPDNSSTINWANFILAFLMGLRFDIVAAGYLLVLFFIVLTLHSITGSKSKFILIISYYYVIVVSIIALFLSAADVPYFNQFYSRISVIALQWLDSPVFIFKMIFQEPRYYLFILPLVAAMIFFYRFLKKIFNAHTLSNAAKPNIMVHITFSILFLLLMFLGIRGRVEIKSPIRIGTAYFCNNSFLNQAGLNPVFTFVTSYLDKVNPKNEYLNLMDNDLAIKNVQRFLKIEKGEFRSPIGRWIKSEKEVSVKPNIVIVIMENMSAAKMKRSGNIENLTPFLDSLAIQGLCFDNIYTSRIHTYNGVFSTLFSFPALGNQHPMKASNMLRYNGIAHTLKNFDYQTIYFTTHDGQFDNIEGFLYHNEFDKVYTKSDYPEEKILSTLGVPDDYLFDFVNSKLDEFYLQNKPFMAAVMTASDHGPYIIPKYFKPKPNKLIKQIVEYADWLIGKFISAAKRKKWFENTIFVFIADHGTALSPIYEMPLNYNHSPLIIFAPKIFKEPKVLPQIGGQIDVFPTIMGILNYPYVNNTFGIDLLNNQRPYIYFSADDKIGVLNDSLFLVINNQGRESLFRYRNGDVSNYINEFKGVAVEMKQYAVSNLQTAQYMIKNNTQFFESGKANRSW